MGLRELGDSVQHWFLSTLVLGALRQLYFFTVAEILVQHGSPYRFSASEERRAEVWGHPAALAVGKGGSLLVGDAARLGIVRKAWTTCENFSRVQAQPERMGGAAAYDRTSGKTRALPAFGERW